jgi:hypothetical protein
METRMDRPRRYAHAADSSTASMSAIDGLAVDLDTRPRATFALDDGQRANWRRRPLDAPCSGTQAAPTDGDDEVGVDGCGEPFARLDSATIYLDQLAGELERREWLCVEGDGPVLHVVHPFVHCLAGSVGCCWDSTGGCDFAWTEGDLIGPVGDVTGAADRVENVLRVGGAVGGAR